jgi:ParB family chromosome partitioning protein
MSRSARLGQRRGEWPGVRMLPVSAMAPHPNQPRRHFDEAALDDLAESIAARGLIQPIVVRPHGHSYQIVAGERRWRAAQRARLHEVPVVVRELTDAETMEIALVENIQREDLNAIEEAEAYSKLIGEFGHTQEALGKLVHKSRSHVANLLRLLDLPQPFARW